MTNIVQSTIVFIFFVVNEFITYLSTTIWLGILCTGLLGLCIGSFLNVVIHRLPIMMYRDYRQQCQEFLHETEEETTTHPPYTDKPYERQSDTAYNLMLPRSQCPNCKTTINWYDNIPILSYLILKGRCQHCQNPISPQYPLIELLSASIAITLYFIFGINLKFIAGLCFCYALLTLTVIDFKHQILPDIITLSLLWLGLIFNTASVFSTPIEAILGAALGYLSLWSIYQIHHRLTGREGMGYGDFKLFAATGAWLGYINLPIIALLASITGLIYAFFNWALRKQNLNAPIAFGPFLAAGAITIVLFGEHLTDIYFNIFL